MSRGLRGSMWTMLAVGAVVACGSTVDDAGSKFGPEASNAPGPGGASDAFGSSGGSGGGKACSIDADCEDQDACTRDQCVFTGEFGTCKNTHIDEGACKGDPNASKDAGDPNDPPTPPNDPPTPPNDPPTPPNDLPTPPNDPPTPPNDPPPSDPLTDVMSPLDPACSNGASNGTKGPHAVYPPFVPLKPDDVPATCRDGFQLRNARKDFVYTLAAKSPAGARAITLDVDYATYTAPNGITVTGVDGAGNGYTLLDSCRLRTWDTTDPTKGAVCRPPDGTIRQFRIDVRKGTTQLAVRFFDNTPSYLRIVGLCDFDITPVKAFTAPPTKDAGAGGIDDWDALCWQPQPVP